MAIDPTAPRSIAEIVPPTPGTAELLWTATQHLTQACMADRGFDYPPLPSPGYEATWSQSLDATSMTPERAATNAYHSTPPIDPPELVDAYAALEQRTADPAYHTALAAQPGDATELGCSLLAQEQLDPGADLESEDFNRIIGDAELAVAATVDADPAYTSAVDAWTACMAARGYDYTHPDQPFSDAQWSTPEPSDTERATAAQDAECRATSALDTARIAAQQQAVDDWIANNAAVFADLTAAEQQLIAQAREALG